MKQYTILRSPVGKNNFTTLGDVRASNKSEAIKKMIQKRGTISRNHYQYVALGISDIKFVAQHTAEGIVKRGKGKI